ncbi:hypothetical protein C0J50_8337 [Silurus asotus]|uniref:THD domain-containing protein n=1 Tax=Silurus asotus TaxID=30991 RepID=A0AAD5B3L0_SILAS|nr:hypothetical protein C0J50_8337 [Silurus asotus]
MADGHAAYPSVFVVDGATHFPPPLPPKPGQRRMQVRRNRLVQNTLLVLVCLTLLGVLMEGVFIYKLHKNNDTSESKAAESPEALKGDQPVTRRPKPPPIPRPSKPLAHLAAGSKKPEKEGILEWIVEGDPIIHELEYRDGTLIVQKEGYYYVYSKISYSAEGNSFTQMVQKRSQRLPGSSMELLTYKRYNPSPLQKGSVRSSYVGGVFFMYTNDAVFVYVNNGSSVLLHKPADNCFGMFML